MNPSRIRCHQTLPSVPPMTIKSSLAATQQKLFSCSIVCKSRPVELSHTRTLYSLVVIKTLFLTLVVHIRNTWWTTPLPLKQGISISVRRFNSNENFCFVYFRYRNDTISWNSEFLQKDFGSCSTSPQYTMWIHKRHYTITKMYWGFYNLGN